MAKNNMLLALVVPLVLAQPIARADGFQPFGGFEWGMTASEFQKEICSDTEKFASIDDRGAFCDADYSQPFFRSFSGKNNVPPNFYLEDTRDSVYRTKQLQLNNIQPYTVGARVNIGPIEIFGAPFELYAVFAGVEGITARDHLENMETGEFPDQRCWSATEYEAGPAFNSEGRYCEYPGRLSTIFLESSDDRGMEVHAEISDRFIELYSEPDADSTYIDEYGDFVNAVNAGTSVELGPPTRSGTLRIRYSGDQYLLEASDQYKEELISRKTEIGSDDAAGQL